jgi:hypothetical protein
MMLQLIFYWKESKTISLRPNRNHHRIMDGGRRRGHQISHPNLQLLARYRTNQSATCIAMLVPCQWRRQGHLISCKHDVHVTNPTPALLLLPLCVCYRRNRGGRKEQTPGPICASCHAGTGNKMKQRSRPKQQRRQKQSKSGPSRIDAICRGAQRQKAVIVKDATHTNRNYHEWPHHHHLFLSLE